MKNMLLIIFLFCFIRINCAPLDTVMIDMTYTFEKKIPYYPKLKPLDMSVIVNGSTEIHNWIQIEEISTSTHMGTHMDAPAHFTRGGITIEEIPVSKLIAPAAVINIADDAVKNPDAVVSVEDLLDWEKMSEKSLNGTIVLIFSGWGKKWHNRTEFLGTVEEEPEKLHFPGISREAAQWMVVHRDIYGVGVETLSIDKGSSKDFPAHNIILGKGMFALENVANLEKIPIYGATLHVMPMKIARASGAPTRIVATFPKVVFNKKKQEYCSFL